MTNGQKDTHRHDRPRVKFAPVLTTEEGDDQAAEPDQQRRPRDRPRVRKRKKMWSPYFGYKRFRFSIWIAIAIGCLMVSNILYLVAFCTNGWGVLTVEQSGNITRSSNNVNKQEVGAVGGDSGTKQEVRSRREDAADSWITSTTELVPPEVKPGINNYFEVSWWDFGLWQCCRRNDNLCVGPRWPGFYAATRAFAVLGLFSQGLTLAWMIGHTIERLLENDPCTMITITGFCFSSGIFIMIATICFGTRWPIEFAHEFDGTATTLSFSFYLAVTTVPIIMAAGVFTILDIRTSMLNERKSRTFAKHFHPMDELDSPGKRQVDDEPTYRTLDDIL